MLVQLWAPKALLMMGVLCALLASLKTSCSATFFPTNSTVLLLSGLPGDLESENQFHNQLQSWLDLLGNAHHKGTLFVFCDAPDRVQLPSELSGKLFKATRQELLEKIPMLSSATNSSPLVVIAWGHGGRQGDTPVFHVRGPRLTPDDFLTLGSQFNVPSFWVLYFRSSGAFASRLKGENRSILSSESETLFNNDPIGMDLLLKLARANPQTSFEALAQRLGRATEDWFHERSLARTEEPTLWEGTSNPRLLAQVASSNALHSQTEGQSTNTQVAVTEIPANELPVNWKGLVRVQPQAFPDNDATILRRRITFTLGASPAITSEQEEFIQILTPEGKHFGDFDIEYSPPDEELNFLECEVLSPDGKLTQLDPDSIREERPEALGDYQFGRRKFFSLPGVVPGAVLHVRYQTQWKQFPLPCISLTIPAGEDLPINDSTIEVSVKKEMPFHFALEHSNGSDPDLRQTTYGSTYRWHFTAVPPITREALTAPEQSPRLSISTFPDWGSFAEWYGRISRMADEVTPALSAKARELTRGASSNRDKVLAIYNYVSGLRYVAVPLGVNSFRPHAADKVLENQFGDCKDKANLFNALLHSLGIQASLVLVPRFSQARENLPGFAFNHAISRVTLDGVPVWVDTTDEVCRFGMLPPGDSGRKVLVVESNNATLSELPQPQPGEHELTIHGELTWTRSGDEPKANLKAVARGFPDYQMRLMARSLVENSGSTPLLTARFRPVSGVLALERQHSSSASALDENFSWEAQGNWVGLVRSSRISPSAAPIQIHSPFWVPKEWDLALHHRKNALFLNEGYPLTLEEDFEFTLPGKTGSGDLPAVSESGDSPLRWKLTWARVGDDKLAARLRVEMAQGELSVADTSVFQKQLSALLSALEEDVNLSQ